MHEGRQQQVAGQSGDAKRNAEHSRKHAADSGDLDGVGKARRKRAGIGVTGRIGEHTLTDFEIRLMKEKVEARRQPHAVHAVGGVGAEECKDREHAGKQQNLL
ncbi:hypothetical protein D3C71_1586900 [compost metagenome]